jgi:hypothetical protein
VNKITFTVPSISDPTGDLNLHIGIRFGNATALPDGYYRFFEAQLEEGLVATEFEYRPIGEELSLCQRYYEVGYMYALSYSSSGTYIQRTSADYKVNKRASPSTTVTVISGTVTAPVVAFSRPGILTIGFHATSTGEAGVVEFTADAEL